MAHLPDNYTTHEQLVAGAASEGITTITTELLAYNVEQGWAIVQATAVGERGTFQGLGDCTPNNANRGIAPHFVRMAETRAVNRALRLYLGQGMVSLEELTDAPAPEQRRSAQKTTSAPEQKTPEQKANDTQVQGFYGALRDLGVQPEVFDSFATQGLGIDVLDMTHRELLETYNKIKRGDYPDLFKPQQEQT